MFNRIVPGEYWSIVTVDPSVESKIVEEECAVEVIVVTNRFIVELIELAARR